jgi:hypothetical protein
MKLLLIVGIILAMIGCSVSREPRSPIVQKAEVCGAGPLAETSTMAVQDWFAKHRDCAVAVDGMCKPVREKAPAQWSDSTEGRVCVAARNIAQWVRKPSTDHEQFQSGWK